MTMQPIPTRHAPSVPKLEEHASPQSHEECAENLFFKPHPFIQPDLTGRRGDAKACVSGHRSDTTIPSPGKLKMLTSEACLKNYAIFDRSEGKDTVIVHPSCSNSPLVSSSPDFFFSREANHSGSDTHLIEAKFASHSSAFLSTVGSKAPLHTSAFAVELEQKVALSNVNLKQDIMQAATFLSVIDEEEESFYENTEEIDALMCSDEELISTGHSPSDVSLNCFSDASNVHGSKETAGKKRKLGCSPKDEADDADSGFRKLLPDPTRRNSNRPVRSVSLHWTGGSHLKDALSGIAVLTRGKQGSAVKDDMRVDGWDYELIRSAGIVGHETGGASKRMKLKSNVRQLRNVVPGGDGLDTVGVLGHTIDYVKCLQRKLRDLGAARGFHTQTSGQPR